MISGPFQGMMGIRMQALPREIHPKHKFRAVRNNGVLEVGEIYDGMEQGALLGLDGQNLDSFGSRKVEGRTVQIGCLFQRIMGSIDQCLFVFLELSLCIDNNIEHTVVLRDVSCDHNFSDFRLGMLKSTNNAFCTKNIAILW